MIGRTLAFANCERNYSIGRDTGSIHWPAVTTQIGRARVRTVVIHVVDFHAPKNVVGIGAQKRAKLPKSERRVRGNRYRKGMHVFEGPLLPIGIIRDEDLRNSDCIRIWVIYAKVLARLTPAETIVIPELELN